jgi:hypothetical protein
VAREDIAWAAGLFEGEGYVGVGGTGNRQPRVAITMTDEEPIVRFHRAVERGTLRSYPPTGSGRKPTWQWSVQGKEDVLHVLGLLWPYLCDRRLEAATEVIERAAKMNDDAGFCKRGHDLSDAAHLYVHQKSGKRHCRTCRIEYARRRWAPRPVA